MKWVFLKIIQKKFNGIKSAAESHYCGDPSLLSIMDMRPFSLRKISLPAMADKAFSVPKIYGKHPQ